MAGIVISGVRKRFGDVQVLRDVSLSVAPGEFVALVGPSGCGKTTLMRIVAGIERHDAGSLDIGGRQVGGLRAADRDVAMVFQSYALYPHLTVAENIAVPLTMRRLSSWQRLPLLGRFWPGARATRAGIAADAAAAADSLGLGAMLGRRPAQLSGGQRQRVALARAIVRSPKAFLMDEPLSNLDAALRVQTRREIVDIHRRVGATTLYVTHDQSEALTMADRVAVMQAGQILQVDTPERIYADPADLRVATFIGSPRINTLPAEIRADGMVMVAGLAMGLRAEGAAGEATLALRPEDLRPDPAGTLPVVTEHLEFLGECTLLHARHAGLGTALTLRLPPGATAAQGPFRLGFSAPRALVFGADGRRRAVRVLEAAHV
ncbi:ABC transporter ATP-binding protein [Roseococcus suduntuyensis]|uniref:Multiple sugar transport system ATP-binding protein n=1 Tax=Roseococcus suduntuyensis TaxID=455361 RepID=A0A840AI62_9PROT|nr:ABC transporter ATP-binding protein [Roseococcus suduntuyensis]MBB3900170.1 multiple sugar transport system ATP-binding protein [Roseococcus suduntuyensis]